MAVSPWLQSFSLLNQDLLAPEAMCVPLNTALPRCLSSGGRGMKCPEDVAVCFFFFIIIINLSRGPAGSGLSPHGPLEGPCRTVLFLNGAWLRWWSSSVRRIGGLLPQAEPSVRRFSSCSVLNPDTGSSGVFSSLPVLLVESVWIKKVLKCHKFLFLFLLVGIKDFYFGG